jgi:D-inositol-3-phosphate glycosyltransferase
MVKSIKIIGPAYPYRGGITPFNERLAREFMSLGYDVEIETFTLQYPSILFPGKTQFSDEPAPADLKIVRSVNSINPFNWLKVGLKIKKETPDLVIVRYWLPLMAPCLGTIAGILRKNKKTVVICLADNIIPHEHRPGDRLLTRYFLNRIDGLVAMSKNVLANSHLFRADLPSGFCIHPLFDNYGEKLSREFSLEKLNLDPRFRYILFFGFIRDYKGLDLLIRAFADARLRKYPVKLLVAGEFYANPEPYLKLIRDCALDDWLVLRTEFIPDSKVSLYFNSADIVVQPYKSASQSGVTQIAYHFGKPMLVTNVGGLSEIIPDGKVGYVVEPEISNISEALVDFFENDRREAFETNVMEEKKRFSWTRMAETFLSVYDSVVNRNLNL